MSTNAHGMPSRVRAIAELGRLLADASVDEAHKLNALELLVQDHADLDAVEAASALWAITQMGPHPAACQALLACAPQLMHDSDGAHQFLDACLVWMGAGPRSDLPNLQNLPEASAALARLHALATRDAERAARLARLAG
jgi:hypothetical protein